MEDIDKENYDLWVSVYLDNNEELASELEESNKEYLELLEEIENNIKES